MTNTSMPSFEKVLIARDSSLEEAMRVLDRGGLGIVLVVDGERKLLGTVTDGDVRRGILAGLSLKHGISEVMNAHPISVVLGGDLQEIRQIMIRHELKHIPIVDETKRVVDLVLASTLLKIPLSNPDITDLEVKAVLDVLLSPHLSLGPKLLEFEEKFAQFIGTKYAIAVNSGTSGLHLCVKSLNLGEGDEVITTPFSFIASANCLLFERAKPVFVDIDPKTLNLDVAQIEKKITSKTKALLPVHVFGHPCEMGKLTAIAQKYNLAIIEDACEAIGAEYRNKRVGTFGNCSIFAFYPNKQMTTGEGGIIATDDLEIARLCRSYRNQGRGEDGVWLSHERIGYNYRLSEMQCALGVVQIDRIEELLAKRAKVASLYEGYLRQVKGITLPYVAEDVRVSWFVYVIQLEEQRNVQAKRNEILHLLRSHGIACNDYFAPIHLQPFYRREFGYCEGNFPVTEHISERTIALPFFNNLKEKDVERVCHFLEHAIQKVCEAGYGK